ncbi:MAG: hypothetical protein U0231_14005 [Nitrospiraceae bacterium]
MERPGSSTIRDTWNMTWAPVTPESPNRLRAILQQMERSGTSELVTAIEPRSAADEWAAQVHHLSYVACFVPVPSSGRVPLDADTSMSPGSLPAVTLPPEVR